MSRLQLGVNLRLALQVHLTEHVKGGLFTDATSTRSGLVLKGSCKLPPTFITAETIRLTVLAVPSH